MTTTTLTTKQQIERSAHANCAEAIARLIEGSAHPSVTKTLTSASVTAAAIITPMTMMKILTSAMAYDCEVFVQPSSLVSHALCIHVKPIRHEAFTLGALEEAGELDKA